MKRISIILMLALSVLMLTQCKKENLEENNGVSSGKKVKVRCEIPMGNEGKSDFTDILNGSVKWSTGTERIYLAVHGDNPQIVELTALTTVQATILAFEGEVDETLLKEDETYKVWYFGNSMNLGEDSYVNTETTENGVITKINGSIANQSGNIGDLGYHHIAMTTVKAEKTGDVISLPLNGTLENQIAIAYMDLTDITALSGDAIIGTEYALECNNREYELSVVPSSDPINISGENDNLSKSFVVLLPNDQSGTKITSNTNKEYIFKDGILANNVYYRYISDAEAGTLTWELPIINGHEYVDLGLPSGLKWATCNVGATAPEDYGNYYAWGEVEPAPDDNYIEENCDAMFKSIDILETERIIEEKVGPNGGTYYALTPAHDAATAKWGGTWRMPTEEEIQELIDECTWTWTSQNEVNGYKVTGPNGKSIFLPAASCRDGSSLLGVGIFGYYWSSVPYDVIEVNAYYLDFNPGTRNLYSLLRFYGFPVRPVSE